MLTPEALDQVYTEACHAMGAQGGDRQALFLARLALLLMKEVGDEGRVRAAIETARNSMAAS